MENESERLDAIMREMLGEDVIALVEQDENVVQSGVKLSRSALKRLRRLEGEKMNVIIKDEITEEVQNDEDIIDEDSDGDQDDDVNDEDMVDSDDSEDLMGAIHEPAIISSNILKSNSGPEIIVYEEVKRKPSLFGSAKQKRTFMSSKMTQIAEIKSSEIPLRAPKKVKPVSTEDMDQDKYT